MKILSIAIATLLVSFASCGQNKAVEEGSGSMLQAEGYSSVYVGELPETLDFAGEAVPLGNFDTRESLRREMLVTLYMHSRTYTTIVNSKRYLSVIEPILERNGIPADFKYLCMAESGLDPEAVSTAGAGGLWQFMPATGKQYALFQEKNKVDERFHIEKSTEAACKYLKAAYARFGSWTLAAAAYNAGSEGVGKRMDVQGTKNYYDTYLPQETMRYVFRILSLKLITSDPQAYGFRIAEGDLYPPLTDYETVSVSGADIEWSKVAAEHGTNYKMLRLLNPWIRDYTYDNKGGRTFEVKVPRKGFREDPQR